MAQLIKKQALVADTWTTLELGEGETPESVVLPTGDIKLAWFDKFTRFENLSQKPYEEFGDYQEEF